MQRIIKNYKTPKIFLAALVAFSAFLTFAVASPPASAVVSVDCPDGTSVSLPPGHTYDEVCANHGAAPAQTVNLGDPTVSNACGGGSQAVKTSIDFGCQGVGNPITDAAFAIIRLLSDGVGLVIIGSIIVGGIQYSASRGEPNSNVKAVERLRSALIALLIYIFGYAILNYIIPVGFLHQ